MNHNKLLEDLKKISETQIEGGDAIIQIKEGSYEGEDIAEIVIANLDQFSVDELVEILQNRQYYMHQGVEKLFPSGFYYSSYQGNDLANTYPAKLAEAVSNSNDSEDITDLYNIFYRQHNDLKTWASAAEVWKENLLENPAKSLQYLDADQSEYVEEILDEFNKYWPKYTAKLRQVIGNYNPDLLQK